MTKAELINAVHEQSIGLSKKDVTDAVELVLATLKETLAEGESIKLSGFGSFLVKMRGARKGRHLQTGKEINIEPRRVVTFKPSTFFKDMVDEK